MAMADRSGSRMPLATATTACIAAARRALAGSARVSVGELGRGNTTGWRARTIAASRQVSLAHAQALSISEYDLSLIHI